MKPCDVMLWTNANVKQPDYNKQAGMDFVSHIMRTEPDVDFTSYATRFSALPETQLGPQSNPELSRETQAFLLSLSSLRVAMPLLALKLLSIVYVTYAFAVHPRVLRLRVEAMLVDWLESEVIDRRTRIAWGIYLWEHWPSGLRWPDKDLLIKPLVATLAREADSDPTYVAEIYDRVGGRVSRRSFLNERENSEDYLRIAHALSALRPQLLIPALERLIWQGRRGNESDPVTAECLQDACAELWEIVCDATRCPKEEMEAALVELVRHSHPDELWYDEAVRALWDCELSKAVIDKATPSNCMMVAMNLSKDARAVSEARARFAAWGNNYRQLANFSSEQAAQHATELLGLINSCLNGKHGLLRNFLLPVPTGAPIVDDTANIYWEMVHWYRERDLKTCLYVLASGFELDIFGVPKTREISDRARAFFFEWFAILLGRSIDDAADVVTRLVSRSGYSTIGEYNCEVLDRVHPELALRDPVAAETALNKGLRNEGSHIFLWKPCSQRLKRKQLEYKLLLTKKRMASQQDNDATNSPSPEKNPLKTLAFVHRNDTRFAVGGFSPVLSVFSYHELGTTVSPFLLLDHIGPGRLLPSTRPQGVEDHPHRGFETVTLVYHGELAHRDSAGNGGVIGPGDVQWMTAGAGIVHREVFSDAFTRQGGPFEMIQLWVNLPAADKMRPARYQSLARANIPVIELPGSGVTVRVVAGEFDGVAGLAQTHSRMNVLDAHLPARQSVTFATADGDTALVYLLAGRIRFGAGETVEENGLAVLSNHGAGFIVSALENSRLLILTGTPLDEPLNGHGPFVMNSYEEILQAYEDVKAGRLGAAAVSGTKAD